MNACLLAATLLLSCAELTPDTLQPPPPPADRWVAEDKLRHFAMSTAATQFAFGAARFALDPEPAELSAAGVALLLGVGKEIVDRRNGGPFSARDLVWDAAGVVLGLVLVRQIH